MMRSLFSAVAGLKNHQTRMDVIGNNIANVNTVGFKESRVTFQDMLSQTLQGASSSSGNRGGTNPMQVGLGMGVSSIDTIFTDGSTQSTGVSTDLSISGNGFFVVSADGGQTNYYTRAGGFNFDSNGNYIIPGTGYKVMGYMADAAGNISTSGTIVPLVKPVGITMPAKASTTATTTGNLNAAATNGSSAATSTKLYDSLGNTHTLTQIYYKVNQDVGNNSGDNTWYSTSSVAGAASGSLKNQYTKVTFNADGTLKKIATINPPTSSLIAFTGLKLNTTAGSVEKLNFNQADNSGVEHSFNVTFTNTGANSWSYSIVDAANPATSLSTGTVAGNAVSPYYTMTQTTPAAPPISGFTYTGSDGTTINTVNIDWGAASQVAANAAAISGSTSTVQTAILNNLKLSTDTTSQYLSFSQFDSAGALRTFKMKFDYSSSTNSWTATVTDAADTTNTALATATGIKYDTTLTPPAYTGLPASITYNDSTGAANKIVLLTGTASAPDSTPISGYFSDPGVQSITSTATFAGLQLNSNLGTNSIYSFSQADNSGVAHTFNVTFTNTAAGAWSYKIDDATTGKNIVPLTAGVGWTAPNYTGLPPSFTYTGSDGATINTENINWGTASQLAPAAGTNAGSASISSLSGNSTLLGTNESSLAFTIAGANPMAVTLNRTALTQSADSESAMAETQNGYGMGTLSNVSFDSSGVMTGVFSNGQSKALGQVAMAVFNNPEGLEKAGDNMFAVSNNSGDPQVGASGSGGRGSISPASLEMSNVDLAQQFSDMIITQRGFQANSKVITTTDEMLQTLTDMKR